MVKRLFDLFCSIVILAVTSPALPLIALLVKLNSPGPVIFWQKRLGYCGSIFTILKFRTMHVGSGREGDIVLAGDKRVTSIGRILRSTHLNELPQLWNVMRGEMSLVGTRPLRPCTAYAYGQVVPRYEQRLEAMPGIAGLPQLRGRAKNVQRSPHSAYLLDIYYIRHQSLCFDCKILLLTLFVMLRRKGI